MYHVQMAGMDLCVMIHLGFIPVQELASMIDHELCLSPGQTLDCVFSSITWVAVDHYLVSSECPACM